MRWNSFTIIGIILILVGLVGLVKGPTFQFDPGITAAPFTWLYYVIVGAFMILNGMLAPKAEPVKATTDNKTDNSTSEKAAKE